VNSGTDVIFTWTAPSTTNTASSTLGYTLMVLNATNGVYVNLDANLTVLTKTYTMAALKTALGYTDAQSGDFIKAKVKVNNDYGSSVESDINALQAIIQGDPAAYTGTFTATTTSTSITLTWTDVTNPALFGYSAITDWKYG
jgi:hypothetical protein